MLRPTTTHLAAILALALCSSSPAPAQDAGYGAELNQLEDKLDADIKACKPIDVQPYDQLAARLKELVERWVDNKTQGGAPIDIARINADSARASKLAVRAKAAAKPKCPLDGGTSEILVDTKVEPPKLSPVTPARDYRPSIQTIENKGPDYVGTFRAALDRYRDAKKRCDGPGMMAARAEMDAAQGAAREILAGEKDLGGKSELLKQMAEQRQAAENDTIGMCPSLTPALAHMLSEPPRVSSEPMTDEEAAAASKALVSAPPHYPTAFGTPVVGYGQAVNCSGPGLGDFAKSAGTVPPAAVIPGSPGAEAAATLGYRSPVGGSTTDSEPNDGPSVGLKYTFKDSLEAGGYGHSPETPSADVERDEPRFRVGLTYEFAGKPLCPVYQDTRVPQPELPNKETFDPTPTGSIDPDDHPPLKVYPVPKEDVPPPPP